MSMKMKSLQGCRTPGSRDECRTAADGRRPLDQAQQTWAIGPPVGSYETGRSVSVAVLGKKIFWGPGPSLFDRQQRLSEITIESIKDLGAGQDLGACAPWPQHRI